MIQVDSRQRRGQNSGGCSQDVRLKLAIQSGIEGALRALRLGEFIDNKSLSVNVTVRSGVEPEPSVVVRYRSDLELPDSASAKMPITVSSLIFLAMSSGDPKRTKAIRRQAPGFGTNEGEVVSKQAAWEHITTDREGGFETLEFKRNAEMSLTTGLI